MDTTQHTQAEQVVEMTDLQATVAKKVLVTRILSNGIANGTRVFLSDGTELAHVIGIEWQVDAEHMVARAKIIVDVVGVDLMASAQVYELGMAHSKDLTA